MKFLIDTQLPPRLASYLTKRGHHCIHTTHFENGHLLNDRKITSIAQEQDRIIITKDSDFSEYFLLKGAPPKILLIEFGNIGNSDLIQFFDLYFIEVLKAFEDGNEFVIFRKDEVIGY